MAPAVRSKELTMAWTEITRRHYARRATRYARWGIRPDPWTAADGRRKVLRFERRELQAPEDAARLAGWQGLIKCGRRVGRQAVEHDADALGLRAMAIDEIAHAVGKVVCGAPLGDLHLASRMVGVEEDEQVGGAVALVFAAVTLQPARRDRDPAALRR